MSIRISQGGRLFGIIAGLGGAAMIGSAALTWPNALVVGFFVVVWHIYRSVAEFVVESAR